MKPILHGTISDNSQLSEYDLQIKVLIEPDKSVFQNLEHERCRYDKLILFNGMEPFDINDIRSEIIYHHKMFDKIYTYDEEVVNRCSNAKKYAFGSCWILTDNEGNPISKDRDFGDYYKTDDKRFKTSFIKSWKNQLAGHQLRHSIPELLKNRSFEIYYPTDRIEYKHPLFVDSMYHIAVENSRYDNYFTEKIIDCFMSKTIPIYWGCPNIGEYFDLNGIIIFNNIEELEHVLSNLSSDFFHKNIKSIEYNYSKAKEYAFFFTRLDKLILNTL